MLSMSARAVVSRTLAKLSSAKAAIQPNYAVSVTRGVAYSRCFTGNSVWRTSSKQGETRMDNCITVGWGTTCKCGCSGIHTEADKELVKFLEEEISAEASAQKNKTTPTLEGYEVKTDGALVELRKKADDETIIIKLNVNHSVNAEEHDPSVATEEEQYEMRAKPNFTVEIEKKDYVISFSCSFTESDPVEEDGFDDTFHITEMAVYKGDWKDSNYSVSGDIMDGHLYDLLMNMLDERGISNKFVDQLEEFCTSYENKQYIQLLQDLKTAFSK